MDNTTIKMEIEDEESTKKVHKKAKLRNSNSSHIIEKLNKNQEWIKWLKESLKHFTLIKKNVYVDRKKKIPNLNELYDCNCRKSNDYAPVKGFSYNCEEGCINRLMCIECFEEICPCLEMCNNRRFQKHQDKCVYPFPSGGKGWGLCAGENIQRGSFITQYIGEVFNINSEEGRARCAEYSSSTCTYMMKTSGNDVIDPTYKGNLARFMNHSCDPNCETQKWHVLGETCIGLFAIKEIEEGQELTFDYGFDAFKTPLTKCMCGTANCKGYLGQKPTDMTVEEWVDKLDNLPCQICGGNTEDDDDLLMLCDLCNKGTKYIKYHHKGFHTFCLKLDKVPDEAWFCDNCLKIMKNRDAEEQEKKIMQGLKQKKEKAIRQKIKLIEQSESDDERKYSDEYEMVYNFQKKLECEAIEELYDMKNQDDIDDLQKIKIKKKKLDEKLKNKDTFDEFIQPFKPKTISQKSQEQINFMLLNGSPMRRKTQPTDISRRVEQKFQEYLQRNPYILDKINLYQEKSSLLHSLSKKLKRRIMINKLEIHLLRINVMLYAKLGCQIYWDLSTSTHDQFLRCKEITVSGDEEQLDIFFQFLQNIMESIRLIKLDMGIIEANFSIPAIFLKRVIGQNHININRLEQQYEVSIVYNKRYVTDECYPLSQKVTLLIKGKKDNIIETRQDVQEQLKKLEVQRIFLTYNETRLVLQHLAYLKRKNHKSEFRLHRDHPFKDINHSFYYIPVKEKELTLIGTREENKITEDEIFQIITEEKNIYWKEEFQQLHILLPLYLKNSLQKIKFDIEKASQVKVHIFDPIHPRKNITITFTGTQELNKNAKKQLIIMIDDYLRDNRKLQNSSKFNLDVFQDQMLYQMTKYLFKYMQNSFLTQNTVFMKNWDIISPYMCNMDHESKETNWFFNCVKYGLGKDIDTQLYICYVRKNLQFLKRFTYNKENYKEEIIKLLQKVINKLISNNMELLRKYETIFNPEELKQTSFYSHVYSKYGYSLTNSNDSVKNISSVSMEKVILEEDQQGNYEKKLKSSLEMLYQLPDNKNMKNQYYKSSQNNQRNNNEIGNIEPRRRSISPYKNHNSSDTSKLRGNASQNSHVYYQQQLYNNNNIHQKNFDSYQNRKKYRSRTRSKSQSRSQQYKRRDHKRSGSSQRKVKESKSAYEKQLVKKNKNLKYLMENNSSKHRRNKQKSSSSVSSSSSSSSSISSDENNSSNSSSRRKQRRRESYYNKREANPQQEQRSSYYQKKNINVYNQESYNNNNFQKQNNYYKQPQNLMPYPSEINQYQRRQTQVHVNKNNQYSQYN